MIKKMAPISSRIVVSYAVKGTSPFEFDGKSREIESITWPEFPNDEKKKQIQESRTARVTLTDQSKKVNHLSKDHTWVSSTDCIWEYVKVIFLSESSENDINIGVSVLIARLDTLT